MKNVLVKNIFTRILKSIFCIVLTLILVIPINATTLTYSLSTSNSTTPLCSLTDTIIVDDDGTADYSTIQEAINNASPGDYIIVKDGIYGDQLTINVSNLTISAASGETPTIYVGAYPVGINVTASDVFIQGFEIYGNGETSGGPFPAIRASTDSQGLSVISNSFKAVTGLKGQVALQITPTIDEITFSSNNIQNYTIGVLLEKQTEAVISNDNIWNTMYPIYHAAHINNGDLYYGSIQDAIYEAEIGQTINVLEGTFNENIIIDRPLTLNGLQVGVNPNEELLGHQSIIKGNINHAISITPGISDVIIDGFTITISNKSNSVNGAGILIGMNAKDITIKNNIIQNITDGLGTDTIADETYGIMVYGRDPIGGQSHITITDNLIQNVEEYGIAINDKTSEVTIQGNVIKNLIPSNHSDFPDPSWPSWVCAAIHLGGQVGPIVNITILGNTLSTKVIGNGTTSPAGGGISFAGVAEWTNPLRLWNGFEGITIRNNKIFDNTVGIITLVGFFNDIPQIHFNNISENSKYGINNTLTTNISATDNWWGDPQGPYHPVKNPNGTGNQVSDYVLFSPWSEIDDFIPPEIEITKPLPGIYFMNYKIWSRYPYPLTFGPITIKVDAYDSISGIYKIEFYKKYHNGSALVQMTYQAPYEWYWNEKTWGFYEIEIIAYDNAGLTTTVRIDYIFVINFGFLIPSTT